MRNKETSKQLLKNPELKPDIILLKSILDKDIFEIIEIILRTFSETNIDFTWRYYKDGKAWLGKAVFKKKTIVWISVWDSCIKASFYFTEKTRPTVLSLDINNEIKFSFTHTEPTGKLIPLILDIKDKRTMQDFTILLDHKKHLP